MVGSPRMQLRHDAPRSLLLESGAGRPADPMSRRLVPLHSGFDRLSVSRIERGQVGAVYLDGDAPSGAGLA